MVGAGGLREPRRKGARVAAPSGCIVPWAARASCWPQPQQLLPVSAAGSDRRCCCSNPPLRSFYTADKTETPVPGSDTGVLGGRGWIARAAHLKKPLRGFFAAGTDGGGRCCSNPPATIPLICFYKTETPAPGSDTGVLGGRGWMSRAAHLKKPRRGFFTRRTVRRVDAVRIHPLYESGLVTKQKPQRTCIR